MKVCVSLRDNAPQNLRLGNLRSEARWERQVLEACTTNPEVDEIYTIGCHWENGREVSAKYKGPVTADVSRDTVLLIQDWNTLIIHNYTWKGVLVNVFSGPWIEEIDLVKGAADYYKDRLIFSLGFEALYQEPASSGACAPTTPSARDHLRKFLADENIVLLPVPGIPEMKQQDSFENKTLLWVSRIIFVSVLGETPSILWALNKLREDPSLSLVLLTGWEPWEVKDYIGGVVVRDLKEDINDLFFRLPAVAPFSDLRSRVRVILNLDWVDVLREYSQAKLLVSTGKQFGGPPLEASMHGVPFVAIANGGALANCPGYLYTGDTNELFAMFDRLMSDRDFYHHTVESYRAFAAARYTFDAFNSNLNRLLRNRGLCG